MSSLAWCLRGSSCALLLLSLSTGFSGCTPKIIVRQHPTADDEGIRYYRPKPYLLISALSKDVNASPDFVSITLDYLPDFAEEYSISVKSGLGVADVSIGLEDGWNLVSINQKLDSQTDETIKATGELLKAVAAPTSGAGQSAARPIINVPARNVPLGYYEAVIGKNRHGKKQLFGFRYVGFMPYLACPTEMCGSNAAACDDGMLYGLTFDSGVMTFKPLGEIATVLPPSQQTPSEVEPTVPLTRSFSRSWTNKGGKDESNVTIQDSGSVPISVPFNEVSR